jgi:hypothetical protein
MAALSSRSASARPTKGCAALLVAAVASSTGAPSKVSSGVTNSCELDLVRSRSARVAAFSSRREDIGHA